MKYLLLNIYRVEVGGGDVRPSPEPPNAPVRLEVAVVEVHRGTHRVLLHTHTRRHAHM